MNIVDEILKWPIIIQGALGSFLFWLVLTLGVKLFDFINSKLREDQKLGSGFGKLAHDTFHNSNYELSTQAFLMCLYGAMHYLLKFILSAFMGFLISNLIPVFGYIGYIFALYFIFRAMSYVTHFNHFKENPEKIDNKK